MKPIRIGLGFICPHCDEYTETVDEATRHDVECPKHPLQKRIARLEATLREIELRGKRSISSTGSEYMRGLIDGAAECSEIARKALEDEANGEAEADADIAAGRTKKFSDAGDAIKWLNEPSEDTCTKP